MCVCVCVYVCVCVHTSEFYLSFVNLVHRLQFYVVCVTWHVLNCESKTKYNSACFIVPSHVNILLRFKHIVVDIISATRVV